MKKTFLLFIISVLLFGCKSASLSKPEAVRSENDEFAYYFTASGNEPFWSLKMGEEQIVFNSLVEGAEKLTFPPAVPIKMIDNDLKMYKLSNTTYNLLVSISKKDTKDTMSGAVSPYSAQVTIKNKSNDKLQEMYGSGRYLTDYRLHDIWVLEELNGKKVSLSDFQKEVPRIEIYASENRFMGFCGCNSINGTLFFEKDILRFSNVMSTMMACDTGNYEGEFLKSLQSTTNYSIGNNRLSLSNSSGILLIFRKVD